MSTAPDASGRHSRLERFFDYARAFEWAFLTDDFSAIAPFFAADARHRVRAVAPLGADDRGREAVVAGLRASVRAVDRRFDVRIPEVLDGPELRDDGRSVWMRFGLRLRRAGLPELALEGEHLAVFDADGRIALLDETLLGGCDEAARETLARHDAALRPAGSAAAPPSADDAERLRDAVSRTLVRGYAAAKSRADVAGALSLCAPGFSIETIPFGLASRDRDESAAQLSAFFAAFPDYRAETEGMACRGEGVASTVAWWGRVSLTFSGALAGHAPTGRTAVLPAFCVFEVGDGLLRRERFFFDLAMLCEGIGVPVEALAETLRGLRAAA